MPQFLEKITIKHKLVRTRLHPKRARTKHVWEKVELDEEIEVHFLGYRTLQNGHLETEGLGDQIYGDYYTYFVADEYIPAMLVIENSKKNPFYILKEVEQQ